jgi:polyhydroxyalkanoate synthesis regulator phasin
MKSEFKNIILAGIGSAAYTYEKANTLVDDLVKKGRLTLEEGKEMTQELKRNFVNKESNTEEKKIPLTKEDLLEVLHELNFATKSDLDNLNLRISSLENK